MAPLKDAALFVVQQENASFSIQTETISKKIRGDIEATDLPAATLAEKGAVKPGDNLRVDGDGTLHANIPNGMNIMGTWDLDASPDAPDPSDQGDLWIMEKDGTLNNTWVGLETSAVKANDCLIYDVKAITRSGLEWKNLGQLFAGGVSSISGADPIVATPTSGTPVISIKASSASQNGYFSKEDYAKLDGIATGAQTGTVLSVSATPNRGVSIQGDASTTPNIDVAVATSANVGVVKLADSDDLDAKDDGVAATAQQLGTTNENLVTLTGRVDDIENADPVTVTGGNGVTVTPNDKIFEVSVKDASALEAGIVLFADTLADYNGEGSTVKAATPQGVKTFFLEKDFSKLQLIT